ncbi:hypothetical protein [Streptomyces sp. NPDC057386]|uniref:hypothetical protein n=1 Tax=unclassified Streptomyces TaxID=2593676 RepID=UPI0036418BC0
MRTRTGRLAATLTASLVALTAGCAVDGTRQGAAPEGETTAGASGPGPAETPAWQGKADQEDAIRDAASALDAGESEGARRIDEGMVRLSEGLTWTLSADGAPHTLAVTCQAPGPRSLTLTLTRGSAHSEWDVTCGDREADRFAVPVGSTFTAHIPAAGPGVDALVLWRFDAEDPADVDGCPDDIAGCDT